jgi:methyl-accepting chemotaxis protein
LELTEARVKQEKFTAALRDYDAAVVRLQAALKASEFDLAMKILDGDVARHNVAIGAALADISGFVQELSVRNGAETKAILERNLATTVKLSATIAGLALLAVVFVQWISRGMRRALESAVTRMQEFVGQTTAAAGQIAGSGQELASGASQQAASLEETSASLEEMSGMTRRNAAGAQDAKQLAGRVRTVVDHGATSMRQNVERRDREDHQDDRRDRVSDEHTRTKRGRGSGSGGRGGSGVCRGGRGGAGVGPTLGHGGAGDG